MFIKFTSILFTVTIFRLIVCAYTENDPEIHMNSSAIAQRWGYATEAFDVETPDGYILTIVRILPTKESLVHPRQVVLLMHGLENSSDDWILNLPNQSAGFYFADLGFDVWLGNCRGNIYARKHKWLNNKKSKYWDFSWQEMAKYDLPATINKVLEVSNVSQLYYVGHSQGTLIGFTKFSEDQNLAKKIRAMFALAPVYSLKHAQGSTKMLASTLETFPVFKKILGKKLFIAEDSKLMWLFRTVCPYEKMQSLCADKIFQTGAGGLNHINIVMIIFDILKYTKAIFKSRMDVYFGHRPGGTSVKNILHFAQIVQHGVAKKYYYDGMLNYRRYGHAKPPAVDVSKMLVPVVLFYSDMDTVCTTEDIEGMLIPRLPNIIGREKLHTYGHGDFLRGINAADDVYKLISNYISLIEITRTLSSNASFKKRLRKLKWR